MEGKNIVGHGPLVQSVVDWIRVELSLSGSGNTTDKTFLATLMSPMAVTRPEQLANFL